MLSVKKILVVGGGGFLGQNIVRHFQQQQYEVGIYDVHIPDFLRTKNISYYVGDVINDSNLDSIVSQYDIIAYLISAIMPGDSMKRPLSSYSTDIPLLITLLESCIRSNVKRVIYSSSGGTVYGENCKPNKESDLVAPKNHYAICKIACEHILQLYNSLYGMENIILRISNPFGIGQRMSSGVGVITAFVHSVLCGEDIKIYGDGSNVRDYIEVSEVARAFEHALVWPFNKKISPVFNIGSGQGLRVSDIVKLVSETLDIKPMVSFSPFREFDVKYNVLNIAKAQKYLDFKMHGDVERSIREYTMRMKSENVVNEHIVGQDVC